MFVGIEIIVNFINVHNCLIVVVIGIVIFVSNPTVSNHDYSGSYVRHYFDFSYDTLLCFISNGFYFVNDTHLNNFNYYFNYTNLESVIRSFEIVDSDKTAETMFDLILFCTTSSCRHRNSETQRSVGSRL